MSQSVGLLCPACKVDLVMTERKDVEIDYCPKCRGVWLDRGELDKIIEKSAAQEAQQQRVPMAQNQLQNQPQIQPQAHPQHPYPQQHPGYAYGERGEYGEGGEYGERGERGHYGKPYRRKSWLEEIFD
jgi:Zn-finger nucleic acid-binding protein